MNTSYKVCCGVAIGTSLIANCIQLKMFNQLRYDGMSLTKHVDFLKHRETQKEDGHLMLIREISIKEKVNKTHIDFYKANNLEKKYEDYCKTLLEKK